MRTRMENTSQMSAHRLYVRARIVSYVRVGRSVRVREYDTVCSCAGVKYTNIERTNDRTNE